MNRIPEQKMEAIKALGQKAKRLDDEIIKTSETVLSMLPKDLDTLSDRDIETLLNVLPPALPWLRYKLVLTRDTRRLSYLEKGL